MKNELASQGIKRSELVKLMGYKNINGGLRRLDNLLATLDEHERLDAMCELNVKVQVSNVCNTPVVQKTWKNGGDLKVHGWIYNINNGLLKDLGSVDSDDCLIS